MRRARRMARRTLSNVIMGMLVLGLCVPGNSLRYIAHGAVAESGKPSEASVRALAACVGALEAEEQAIPRAGFDLSSAVTQIGKEPQALFGWVRDHTWWVPYRGMLRGDVGVLMDRQGNSLDRSMLLYAMLRNAGVPARLARAKLTESRAKEVLAKVRRPIPARRVPAAAATSEREKASRLTATAQRFGLNADELRASMKDAAAQRAALAQAIAKRSAEQSSALLDTLRRPAAARPGIEPAEELAAAEDHWWVQVQAGDKWVDYDPMLPDAKPGDALASAEATLAPKNYGDLPKDELHRLTVRVVVEFDKAGAIKDVPVLEQELIPAALIGQRLSIRHVPLGWPNDLAGPGDMKQDAVARIRQAAADQHQWMPVLTVGSKSVQRYAFTDDGTLDDATLPTFAQNALAGRKLASGVESGSQSTGGSVKNMLGGGRIGGMGTARNNAQPPAEKEAHKTRLTAEWIEFEFAAPGSDAPRKIRRQVFDLRGPGARAHHAPFKSMTDDARVARGMALLGKIELLPVVCNLQPEFVSLLEAQRGIAAGKAVLEGAKEGGAKPLTGLFERAEKSPIPSGRLLSLALARLHNGGSEGTVYIDRQNLLALHSGPELLPDGSLILHRSFDIVANDVAVAPGAADSFLVRLRQGVVDTNMELLLGGGKHAQSAAQMLDATPKEDWVALHKPNDSAWRRVKLPANIRARIEQDLKDGQSVLAPARVLAVNGAPTAGWWRIDPRTGTALGMGPRGWGQTVTEEQLVKFKTAMIILTLFEWMICMMDIKPDESQSAVAGKTISCALSAGIDGALIAMGDEEKLWPLVLDLAKKINDVLREGPEALGLAEGSGGHEGSHGAPFTPTPTPAPTHAPPPPPFESDPHAPGLIQPPWSDLG